MQRMCSCCPVRARPDHGFRNHSYVPFSQRIRSVAGQMGLTRTFTRKANNHACVCQCDKRESTTARSLWSRNNRCCVMQGTTMREGHPRTGIR